MLPICNVLCTFQVIKDNCNPIYDESFEYVLSQGELNNKLLEVTVGTQKQLFYSSSNVLGQVLNYAINETGFV